VTLWRSARELRERLTRLETLLHDQTRVAADQQRAVRTLQERLAAVERDVSGLGTHLEASFAEMRRSIGAVGAAVDRSLATLGATLRDLERAEVKTGRAEKGLTQELRRLQQRLARVTSAFDLSVDERFVSVAGPLVEARRTLLGYDRLYTLWQAAANVAHLDLPSVEIGTYRGGSAALLAQALQLFGGQDRELHVVDTFEGHLDATLSEHDPQHQQGKFKDVDEADVRRYLGSFPGVRVHKGDATTVVAGWPERRYALVHLDVDLYLPILGCLQYFGPRVADHGVIVVDDYEAPTCPGVSRAVREYLELTPVFQLWRLQVEQVVLIKDQSARLWPQASRTGSADC
jgi:hypothetical protein